MKDPLSDLTCFCIVATIIMIVGILADGMKGHPADCRHEPFRKECSGYLKDKCIKMCELFHQKIPEDFIPEPGATGPVLGHMPEYMYRKAMSISFDESTLRKEN